MTQISQYSLFILGLFVCGIILAYSRKHVGFITSFILAGWYFYCTIAPYFDPSLKVFGVMLIILTLSGALVGGVAGILLPRVSVGLTLGCTSAMNLCAILVVVQGGALPAPVLCTVAFVLILANTVLLAQKYPKACETFRTGQVLGLVLALAVDSALPGTGLVAVLRAVLQTAGPVVDDNSSSSSSTLCVAACWVPALLVLWDVTFVAYVLGQAIASGSVASLLASLRSVRASVGNNSSDDAARGVYSAVRTSDPSSSTTATASASTLRQRTFFYPNALVYNYFDPDAVPEMLEAYSETIFPIVQQLAHQYGFQIDNSRNQAEHMLLLLFNETKAEDSMISVPAQRLHVDMFGNYRKWCARMGVVPSLLKDVAPVKNYECLLEDMLLFLLIWGEAANLKHMPECLCFLLHKALEEHVDYKNATTWTYQTDEHGVPRPPSTPHAAVRYPGFYLDMVVTPLYEVVAAALTQSGDHRQRKTYDDFNEFFWSPACLRYELHDAGKLAQGLLATPRPGANSHHRTNSNSSDAAQSLAEEGEAFASFGRPPLLLAAGLAAASKTYMEKRSWLHPLQSMNRVFEWHVITFTLLAAWAFANLLQWTNAYSIQAASFVFWEISFLGIVWTALEVWTLFPGVNISDPSIWGYLLRLLAGLLVLTYQSIYYHWSFVSAEDTPLERIAFFHDARDGMRAGSDSVQDAQAFWWWQYVWLSLLSCSLYLLESLLCWVPGLVDALMTWDNDFVQAFLNVCYPLSQLYVAKTSNVKQSEVFGYIFFWLTLLAFKLWFGYRYVVAPVSIPTLVLYDDYMNYYGGPEQLSFVKTSLIVFFWWFPHFLVYLIDLSIWYSVWASAVGGFIAIIDRQGAVRESPSFREHFMRAPNAFCKALLPAESDLREDIARHFSTASLTGIERAEQQVTTAHEGTGIQMTPTVISASSVLRDRGMPQGKARSTADIANIMRAASERVTAVDSANQHQQQGEAHRMLDALDRRSQRWVVFGRVWNEIIERLWLHDHISAAEKNIFLFTKFDWLSKPIYLPLFQTAGSVGVAVVAFRDSSEDFQRETDVKKKMKVLEKFHVDLGVAANEAVSEAWEITAWVFQRLLGTVHYKDVERLIVVLSAWATNDLMFSRFGGDSLEKLMSHLGNVVNILLKAIPKRKSKPVVTTEYLLQRAERMNAPQKAEYSSSESGSGRVKKSVSTGFLSALGDIPSHQQPLNGLSNGQQQPNAAQTTDVVPPLHSTTTIKKKNPFQALQPLQKRGDLEDSVRDKVRDELRYLLSLVRTSLKVKTGPCAEAQDLIDRLTFMLSLESGFIWSDEYASTQLDDLATDLRMPRALEKLQGLLQLRVTQVELRSHEARRRLNFFLNSLFMDMPTVATMRFSKEYTTITPYYSEDILLAKSTLQECNSDGVSTILYLQTLFKTDWMNFLERRGIRDDQQIWSAAHLQELRMWASCRAQTLYRTVEGMMYTEAAIRLLADLEDCHEEDKDLYAKVKFNYVVACQIYGPMKQSLDPKADDIEFLLTRHPNLRVAYVDTIRASKTGDLSYYSVLIKHDPHGCTKKSRHPVSEVYRLKLPGNPIIGEGKPENQNHALVFTRGRYLQAIDMNQDGYFEEALKMRNLLEEFDSGCVILGFREHIFTGSVSSVANYMAMQELSFVTLGQRVLSRPLRIRQHYGHPDLFKKFFVMTEGGMSKASRGINLSEDVFAGFNATLRGHSVGFKEYVQVGKGRDVGLQQTYKFEAKLSQGNAEQSLSRDMSRICGRLDFFRLMSFYYGGIGHYMANTMVMFTLVVVVYTMVALAIFNEEGVNGRPLHPEGVLQLLLSGMGLLQTMPLIVTLTVEKGVWQALSDVGFMILSGGPLYFIFHIETKSYYFSQTLMAGGAMYRPTGRGFVTQHSSFDENFRFFAASHIYLGFELFVALILFGLHTTSKQYGGLTWSLWLTVASFLLGPFWFNPLSFEWDRIQDDYLRWTSWMAERGGTSEQAWDAWWKEETRYFTHLSLSWKIFLAAQRASPWVMLAVGIAGAKFFTSWEEQARVLELLAVFAVFLFANWVLHKLERAWSYAMRRFATLLVWGVTGCVLARLYLAHLEYVRYTVALYYLGAAFTLSMLLLGFHGQVAVLCKVHDYVVGHSIFALLSVLALLQLGYFQTWLLYHNALSAGVEIEDILKHARHSKDVVGELRAQVAEQQELIRSLISTRAADGGSTSANSVDGEAATTSGGVTGHHHNQDNERTALLKKAHTGSGAVTSPRGSNSSNGHPIVPPIPAYGATTSSGNTWNSNSSSPINAAAAVASVQNILHTNSERSAFAPPKKTPSLNKDSSLPAGMGIASSSPRQTGGSTSPLVRAAPTAMPPREHATGPAVSAAAVPAGATLAPAPLQLRMPSASTAAAQELSPSAHHSAGAPLVFSAPKEMPPRDPLPAGGGTKEDPAGGSVTFAAPRRSEQSLPSALSALAAGGGSGGGVGSSSSNPVTIPTPGSSKATTPRVAAEGRLSSLGGSSSRPDSSAREEDKSGTSPVTTVNPAEFKFTQPATFPARP